MYTAACLFLCPRTHERCQLSQTFHHTPQDRPDYDVRKEQSRRSCLCQRRSRTDEQTRSNSSSKADEGDVASSQSPMCVAHPPHAVDVGPALLEISVGVCFSLGVVWSRIRSLLGGPDEVRRFLGRSCQRVGEKFPLGCPDGLKVGHGETSPFVRDRDGETRWC
jgi:hypothetical protein